MNDISQYKSVVGGGKVSPIGAVILIAPRLPGVQPSESQGTITTVNPTFFDVENWQAEEAFLEAPLACGGQLGATASRRIGYAYTFTFDVILDLRKQPEISLRYVDGATILFRLGSARLSIPASNSDDGAKGTGNSTIDNRFYWLPYAKLTSVGPLIRPGEKKKARQHVTGTASSHMLLLPELGSITFNNGVIQNYDTSTLAGGYAAYLASGLAGH